MPSITCRHSAAFIACLVAAPLFAGQAAAEGSLGTRCEKLPELIFGTDPTGYKVSQASYDLVTGKCYQLEISSTGNKEYAVRGPAFFHNTWLRKVEAGGAEIKSTGLFELEFENAGKVEIFFVPIQMGKFTLTAEGLADKGTFTTFNVK